MGIEQDWDARLQLTPEQLPAGLTHRPSREFLLHEGLPEAVAFLDFYALDAPVLEPFTPEDGAGAGRDGTGADGDGGELLFVLGETTYTAHTAIAGDAVVLDGVTGEVLLASRRRGSLRRDVLATGLPALVELMREVDAVALAAEEPEAIEGARGPAVVAEVVEVVRARLRAIDPALFEAYGDAVPPHWETALLVRSLAWGALPGGPGALAYEVGPELVADLAALAADGRVRRFRPEELPAGLTHAPTRRLLTEIGLPLGGAMLGVHADGPLITMAEAYPDYFAPADGPAPDPQKWERDHQRHHLALAGWPHDLEIALDGATGRVELPAWNDPGIPEAYLNRDVSALVYAVWTCERLRAERRWWDYGRAKDVWQVFDPAALLDGVAVGVVAALDPEAFAGPDHSWQLLADDDHMGGLL